MAETPFLQRCIFSSQCICGAAVVVARCCLGGAGTGGAQQLGRHLPLQRVICGGRAAFQPGTDTTAQTNPQTERPEGSTRSIQPDLPGRVKARRFYLCSRQRNGNAALEGRLSRGTSASLAGMVDVLVEPLRCPAVLMSRGAGAARQDSSLQKP